MFYKIIKPFNVEYQPLRGDPFDIWDGGHNPKLFMLPPGTLCRYVKRLLCLETFYLYTFLHNGREFQIVDKDVAHYMIQININYNTIWNSLNA